MDQIAPDAQPPIGDQRQPAIAAPESEPRAVLASAQDATEFPLAGAVVAAPADGSAAEPASPLRLSAAQRRALRRRRRRIRLALFCAVLLSALFAGPSQNDWVAAATNAREAWRYDRALAFYQQAMRRDPADPRPYCLTGEVLALQQENRAASAAYTRCRALGEDTAAVALALGDLANASGDSASAQREWQRSISRGGITARRRLALWHEARGEFDDAALQWQALGANDGQAREHLGLLALRLADYATAQREFLAARLLPGFYGQEAVDADFVQLAALGTSDPNASTATGVAFVRADLPIFARAPLERAVAATPDDATAQAYLAWVNLLAGQQAAAAAALEEALALAPNDPFARFVAASAESERGEWEAAVSDCFIAIQNDDKNPALWLLMGRAQEGERAYLDAELSYERAAAVGTEPEYTQQLLEFYISHRLGLADGRAYDAAVRGEVRWPTNAPIRRLEGQIDDLLGQESKAYDAWTAALRLDPSDPEPWFIVGQYAYTGGQLDAALVYLRTAAALQPGSDWAARARKLLTPLPRAAI